MQALMRDTQVPVNRALITIEAMSALLEGQIEALIQERDISKKYIYIYN